MFEIEVRDSGIGIAADQLEQIFERFHQLDASPTRRHGGLGLGLAISHGLMTAMGGELEVQSRVGQGSRFVVRVPLVVADGFEQDDRVEVARFADTARLHPLRVLVVEDNAVNQRVMRALLQRLGYRAEVVDDGHGALDAILRDGRRFDVVLMDVHMPGIDGLDTTRRLRAALADEQQPAIIGVTASALPSDRLTCIEAGMDAHLSKPVRPDALRAALLEHGRSAASPPATTDAPAAK